MHFGEVKEKQIKSWNEKRESQTRIKDDNKLITQLLRLFSLAIETIFFHAFEGLISWAQPIGLDNSYYYCF